MGSHLLIHPAAWPAHRAVKSTPLTKRPDASAFFYRNNLRTKHVYRFVKSDYLCQIQIDRLVTSRRF